MNEALLSASPALSVAPTHARARSVSRTFLPGNDSWQKRSKMLMYLNDELPHGVAVEIEQFEDEGTLVKIGAVIYCEKKSHKGMIIGKEGQMLKKIGITARIEAEKLLDKKVSLKLWVKVRKDWRSDEKGIRSFGYREEGDH